MHVNPGSVNLVRIEGTRLDDDLRFNYCDLAASGDIGVEVTRSSPIDQISMMIGLPCLHQRQICSKATLKNVLDSIKDLMFLALRDDGADARSRIEPRNACAPRSQSFGQRTL